MESIAKIFIALLNLLEAEGRAFQRGVVRIGVLLLITIAASVLAACGLIALATAFYWLLLSIMPPSAAIGVLGLTCLAVAGGLTWIVKILVTIPETKPARKLAEPTEKVDKPSHGFSKNSATSAASPPRAETTY